MLNKMLKLKLLVPLFAFSSALTFANIASAAIMQYSIEGTFDTDSLAGLDYLEIFTFDDSSKPNVLGSVPWTTEILSYSLDVESLSKHWTLADWPMEHTFSQWVDTNGFLNSRAYTATPGPPGNPLGNPPAFTEFFDDGAPNSRTYHVKWYDWSKWNTFQTNSMDFDPTATVTAVPEPSSILGLLTFSTLGAGATLKRKL